MVANNSNTPTVSPFSTERFSQPIQFLYPQTNRDNPKSDPQPAKSFALPTPIGQVVVNEPQNSITKETIQDTIFDFNIGFGITAMQSNTAGTAHTIFTTIDHGLNRVVSVGIASSGVGYGNGNAGYLYNARLVSTGAATTQGQNATARLQVNSSGNIVAVKVMDGGSAYQVGESFEVVGVGTTSGHTVGVVTVTKVYSNIGDTLSLAGVLPESNNEFNTLYRITGISTTSAKEIQVASSSAIGAATTLGIGLNKLRLSATATLTGKTLDVTAFNYNATTGIGIVTTAQRHGLLVDNKIKLGGATSSLYQGDFIVKKINNQTSFDINVGTGTTTPATTGTIRAYQYGFASAGGNVSIENENLGGRQTVEYAGITTTISSAVLSESATTIQIADAENTDIKLGDFLMLGNEIVRVKTTVTSGSLTVFRGVLGTRASTHAINTVIRKIRCRPIEFRRNSIIRASGHTFEYVGFGSW